MLIAIIKDNYNNSNNYLYFEKEKNQCYGYSIDKNGINFNTNVLKLFQNILRFNKNCKFIKKKNGYDIFFDDKKGFFHFFKDDIEDFEMFFQVNFNKIDLSYNTKKNKLTKKEKLRRIAIITFAAYTIAFASSDDVRSFSKLMVMKGSQYHLSQEVNDKIYNALGEKLNSESAVELILNTNTLIPEERVFLANKDLLDDIFYYYKDTKMEYAIINNLKNLSVKRFKEEYNFDSTSGFYSFFLCNDIYICDNLSKDSDYYYSVLAHEFIHLLQSNFTMIYIKEATAELISSEYFNIPVDSYIEPVQNLKLLVDVIGPKPIFKLMFSDDSSEFKSILKKYFTTKEYTEIITLFMKTPQNCTENDHRKIKNYIHKLYSKIHQSDILDDHGIYNLNGEYVNKTSYFNERKMFNQEYPISSAEVNYLIDNNKVYETRKYIYGCEITKEEYQSSRKTDVFYVKHKYYKIYRKSDEQFDNIDGFVYLGTKRYLCSNTTYDISFDDSETPLVNVLSIEDKFTDQMINTPMQQNKVLY